MVRADDGTYIGKVDGVIGSTDRPLLMSTSTAHGHGHPDRRLGVRSSQEKPPTEQDRRQDGATTEGPKRPRRKSTLQRRGGRDNRVTETTEVETDASTTDKAAGPANLRRLDLPEMQQFNFARRTVCNRCEEPDRGGGQRTPWWTGQPGFERSWWPNNRGFRNDRGGDRRSMIAGGRDNRGGEITADAASTFNDNDWTCPQCNNSNFSFRNVCNRCELPTGWRRWRWATSGGRSSYSGQRNDRRQGGGYRNDRGDRGGDRRSSYGGQRSGGNRGFRDGGGGRR